MNEQSQIAAGEHYNRACEALRNDDYELAISEYHTCLNYLPEATVAILALYNLDYAISGKFDFFNRKGPSLTDYEAAWSLRGQNCLNKAIEIYEENQNQFTDEQTANTLRQVYLDALESRDKGMAYGVTKLNANGEIQVRDFDVVESIKLPPLYYLDEQPQEQKIASSASTGEQRPKTFFEFVKNMSSQCGWQVTSGGRDEWVIMRFTINNRNETVDMFYQTTTKGIPVICFTSEVIPMAKDSPVEEFQTVFDNYFLRRNMKTFRGRWGIFNSDENKEWLFIITVSINKITVEEFREAVLEILEERQEFYNFMKA